MLDGQNLSTVAQRALRQQANLGKAVQDNAGRLDPLDHLEDLAGGFAQFQVGGIEQCLLLFGIEQVFRRRQLEDMDVFVHLPAMGQGALAQLAFGFRERDVQGAFAGLRACQQEVQRHGGLAGARLAFEQKHMSAGQSAIEDIVQTFDTGGGLVSVQIVG
ncbi:hypothetical protein D9M73_192160 [compost metagenome]